MTAGRERSQSTATRNQVFYACGLAGFLGSLLREATTLLGHILSCLGGELLQAALWIFLTICRALAAQVLDFERLVVCYQCLATLGPLVHCLLLGK